MRPLMQRTHFCVYCKKGVKKPGSKPRNYEKYALTKIEHYDTITIHTVIVCLFMVCTPNKDILPQEWADVKHQVLKNDNGT